MRLGGIALSNGLVLVSSDNWAAAIREDDGSVSVASGRKPRLPGTGQEATPSRRAGGSDDRDGIPLIRGLGRFGESLMVLGLVRKSLPGARLPFESRRVATALAASMAGATAVRAMTPRSVLAQEAGTALAAFVPAMLAVKDSPVAGYHGAEHKVIGAHEQALRTLNTEGYVLVGASGTGKSRVGAKGASPLGGAAAASKEHDRCGSNLVGPFLFASVLTNLLARGRHGRRTTLRSAVAGAASLGLSLEALRWAENHPDSVLTRLMMLPGKAIQKSLTTSEPTPEQLEVGERALAELLRLEQVESD